MIPYSTSISEYVTALFVVVDDLVQIIPKHKNNAGRKANLSISECITIALLRYSWGYNNWLRVYNHIRMYHRREFPTLGSYKCFVECMNRSAREVCIVLEILMRINTKISTGVKIIDSSAIPVCANHRIKNHKVARDLASRYKCSMGYFYGFKIHLCTDLNDNILLLKITTAATDDRVFLKNVFTKLKGIFVADCGYISKEWEEIAHKSGSLLLTCTRSNMKRIASYWQIVNLYKRIRIEGVYSIIKSRLGLVSSLPRSISGLLAHYLYVIFAYQFNKSLIS